MPNQTFELVYLKLKPGTDITTGEDKAKWNKGGNILTSQPGCNAFFYGTQIEYPDTIQFVINWDSLEAHQAFAASPAYPSFLQQIASMLSAPPHVYHLSIPAELPAFAALEAPVTECASFYFDPSYDDAVWAEQFKNYYQKVQEVKPDGYTGVAAGRSIEPSTFPNSTTEGVENGGAAKLFGFLVGWQSIEKFEAFVASPDFQEVLSIIKDGPKEMSVVHVVFNRFGA